MSSIILKTLKLIIFVLNAFKLPTCYKNRQAFLVSKNVLKTSKSTLLSFFVL